MRSNLAAAALFVAVASLALAADAPAKFVSTGTSAFHVAPGSRLWLDGDSTLHRFSAEAKDVGLEFSGDSAITAEAKPADLSAILRDGVVKAVTVNVPVAKLSSGESGLDENMVKALKGGEHPAIVFRSERVEAVPSANAEAPLVLKIRGKIAIAGVEKAIDLEARASRTETGLRLVGSKDLLMSDFDVHPPVLMMGMIKTKDLVTVRFDLQLQAGR